MIRPPTTPPTAPAVCTEPKMRLLLPVRARIIGAKTVKANAGKQVADEEDQLQAEQAGAGENIFEAIGGFFQDVAAHLLPFFGLLRLRHEDDQQRADGKDEGGHVDEHDAGDLDEGQ